VELRVPALPLAAGEYSVNLFLSSAVDPETRARQPLDARGWTYGNGLFLSVAGEAGPAVCALPLAWHQEPLR
jgi:lipopolysaccharide transport system ATP-binding protein